MAEKKKSEQQTIKHFMRPTPMARDKEVVVEHVQMGSATFQFLQRMEERRKKRECMLSLDMRGKVPGECRSYVHKNRVYWLDDVSHAIFQKGLEENNNVFITETYEAIVDGKHTFKGIQKEQTDFARRNSMENEHPPITAASNEKADDLDRFRSNCPTPELIQLGYYKWRNEDRLQYVTDITCSNSRQVFTFKTKDISPAGLKIISKHVVNYSEGETVNVTFTGFNEELGADLFDVCYKIIATERTEYDFRIRLQLAEGEHSRPAKFIRKFIEKQLEDVKQRRKIDQEDERLTAYSLIVEQYYSNSTATIPFVLAASEESELHFSVLCENENNKKVMTAFQRKDGSYDFSYLCVPDRIKYLYRLMQEDGQNDPLLVTSRSADHNSVCITGSFEFSSEGDWIVFLTEHQKDDNFSIFKLMARPIDDIDDRKVQQRLFRLLEKSEAYSNEITKQLAQIRSMGVLLDITEQYKNRELVSGIATQSALPNPIPKVEAATLVHNPEVLTFGSIENRFEDRYKVSLAAEIEVNGRIIGGETVDISVRGMCIALDSDSVQINRGDSITVCLSELHKRAKQKVRLDNLPYEVTGLVRKNKLLLHLRRERNAHWDGHTHFFQDLISRNKGKIELDISDVVTAAKSRLYSSLAAENVASVPVYVFKQKTDNERQLKVALPQKPGSFVEFFEISDGVYDFSSIAHSQRLARLLGTLRTRTIAESIYYLYKKQVPYEARFEILSAAEQEFVDRADKKAFIDTCMQHDYCIVKVVLTQAQVPQDVEINTALSTLVDRLPRIANKLQEELSQIVAVGDIVDVTQQLV